ncbi:hypothetical protein D1AOALGA4SA_9141 [Olavius algarvensis Delta 1 endosymbiont]|nr:hypothetical protein D1AOALGA4SA_9141 [Olavius algarvensis Delta 1 endosymbiont]
MRIFTFMRPLYKFCKPRLPARRAYSSERGRTRFSILE